MGFKAGVYKILKHASDIKTHFSGEVRSRVLIYHHIGNRHVPIFKKQLDILKALFDEMVTASEFIALYQSGRLRDKRYCCITFDDGFESVYTKAKPILDALDVTATLFVPQSFYDLKDGDVIKSREEFVQSKFPRLAKSDPTLRSVTKEHISDFIRSGYEIGAHTYSHTSVSDMTEDDFFRELSKQRQFFKNEFNYHINSFAYPYGRSEDIPSWGERILKKAGYKSGFTGISRSTEIAGLNPYEFPRTSVSLELSEKNFVNLLRGSHDFLDKITLQY